jgi:hypothetical protein
MEVVQMLFVGLVVWAYILFQAPYIWLLPIIILIGSTIYIKKFTKKKRHKKLINLVCLLGIISILIFAVSAIKKMPKQNPIFCYTNLHGLGNAINVYTFDYEDKYPTPSKWTDLLIKHADVNPKSFICPGFKNSKYNFAMNRYASADPNNISPDMVILFESKIDAPNQFGGQELIASTNHLKDKHHINWPTFSESFSEEKIGTDFHGCLILFHDGSIRFVKEKDFPSLKWKPGNKKRAASKTCNPFEIQFKQ